MTVSTKTTKRSTTSGRTTAAAKAGSAGKAGADSAGVIKYRDLLTVVAEKTGRNTGVVSEITDIFLTTLIDDLKAKKKIRLGEFGTMRSGNTADNGAFTIKYAPAKPSAKKK